MSRLGTPGGGTLGTLMVILYLVKNPISIIKLSRRFSPCSVKIPERIGASFISSKGPPRSRKKSPTPEPSCPSRITSRAFRATMGDTGVSLVKPNNRHIKTPHIKAADKLSARLVLTSYFRHKV